MTAILKTDYARYQRPQDDPVWKGDGLHAGGGGDRVTFVNDAVEGKVIQFRVDGGGKDTVFGTVNADRSEVMNPHVFGEGDSAAVATKFNLADYDSGGGQWHMTPFQFHSATAGATQSPIHNYVENDVQLGCRLWGGPGQSIRKDQGGVTLPKTGWIKIVQWIVFSRDPSKGRHTCWINGVKVWDVQTATIVDGVYLKVGQYRATENRTSIIRMTDFGIFSTLEEAFTFVGAAPVPTPTPTPPPNPVPVPGDLLFSGNIQQGQIVPAGKSWEITTTPKVDKVIMDVDGSAVNVTSETNVYALEIPDSVEEGAGTLAFTLVKGAQTKKIGPFSVIFTHDLPDIDVDGAVELLQECLTEYFMGWSGHKKPYTVTQAKTTRVYRAVQKLGGKWPTT